MGWGKILGLGAAAALLVLPGIAFLLPREVRVERSVRVEASPQTLFDLVEDVRRHDLWMPWGALDPRPQVVFGMVTEGEGATYFWIGDHLTHGTLTLHGADRPRWVAASVDLASVDKARLEFRFEPDGAATVVTATFLKDLGYNPLRRYLGRSHRNAGEALLEAALPRLRQAAETSPGASVPPDTAGSLSAF
jgi:hypothetical protein